MPPPKKYNATPLQVLTDTAMRDDVRRIAAQYGVSQAEMVRRVLAASLPLFDRENSDGVRPVE